MMREGSVFTVGRRVGPGASWVHYWGVKIRPVTFSFSTIAVVTRLGRIIVVTK